MRGFHGMGHHGWGHHHYGGWGGGWGGSGFGWIFPLFLLTRLFDGIFNERPSGEQWPAPPPLPAPQPQSAPVSVPRPVVQCVNCQTNISADYAYCPHCCFDPRRRAECAYCGRPITPGRATCQACGAPVK